jgi:hypothetical protein
MRSLHRFRDDSIFLVKKKKKKKKKKKTGNVLDSKFDYFFESYGN